VLSIVRVRPRRVHFGVRTRLLAYAARVGASPALRARVAEVLMQPHHALPHDDHFHVRVGCPASSPDCVEWPLMAQAAPKKSPSTLAKTKPPHTPKLPTKKLVRARSTGHVQIEAPKPAPSATPDPIPPAPAPEPAGNDPT
jgi:penicillin-insensitive murein endopeptidase